MDAKEYFDHNTAQSGPNNLSLGLFFLTEFLATKYRSMFIAHTQGDEPELLEEDAILLLDCGNQEPGVGFQVLDGAHMSFPKLRLTGGRNAGHKTSMAKVLTMRSRSPPHSNTQSANQQDGEQLDHSPPTPELSRYDSGVVIDTQFYVNSSKTGNKDNDSVQGIGQMCPVGMNAAGFKDSGRWDGTSYHVELSLSAALV